MLNVECFPVQVGPAAGAVLHRPGGEVHQVLRLVRVGHQSTGALGSVHQPQAGGQGTSSHIASGFFLTLN